LSAWLLAARAAIFGDFVPFLRFLAARMTTKGLRNFLVEVYVYFLITVRHSFGNFSTPTPSILFFSHHSGPETQQYGARG
jgi:hypothetical protein